MSSDPKSIRLCRQRSIHPRFDTSSNQFRTWSRSEIQSFDKVWKIPLNFKSPSNDSPEKFSMFSKLKRNSFSIHRKELGQFSSFMANTNQVNRCRTNIYLLVWHCCILIPRKTSISILTYTINKLKTEAKRKQDERNTFAIFGIQQTSNCSDSNSAWNWTSFLKLKHFYIVLPPLWTWNRKKYTRLNWCWKTRSKLDPR